MQVEWEITLKCNYKCHYCTNLDTSLRPVYDERILRDFIKGLGEQYPGVEVFVFGGEPFTHPKIEWIIKCFNEFNIPFVIQTNLSLYSVEVINSIKDPFIIQVSIHPTEVSIDKLPAMFNTDANIRTIDVMYSGKEAMMYYFAAKKLTECKQLYLTPVTDFGDGVSDILLAEYIGLREHPVYSKLIKFEHIDHDGIQRSDMWLDPKFNPRGKPCMYKDRYFLYSPNLDLYNCCYRLKTDGICPKDKCFLM
jgi:sulfatase maturation enzyme AslB (radical SAM superfamily)